MSVTVRITVRRPRAMNMDLETIAKATDTTEKKAAVTVQNGRQGTLLPCFDSRIDNKTKKYLAV